jgi:HD-GYP domain-containing protein (c-di-GMP phosphodiesterase class II)
VGYLQPSFEGSERPRVKREARNADFRRVSTAATTIPAPTAQSHVPAELDPAVQGLIAEEREKHSRRLRGRTLSSAVVWTVGFFAVAGALAAFVPARQTASAATIVALVVAYALASRIEFEVRTGYAMATQIILVPILFLAPLTWAPLIVCAASALSRAFDIVRGRILADRLLLAPVYSWHTFGPVAVLLVAGDRPPSVDHWPVYVAALVAQFGVDFAASGGRDWIARGVPPWTQLPFMGLAFVVDAALAPIGLLAALVAVETPSAIVAVLPLLALLKLFANERQVRIDHALELSHAYRGTALLLGDVVEADDAYTGSHSRDVVDLVLDVSDRLGLNAADRRDAEFAALLHDVGKIRIPGEIINKPAALTPEERAVIETHTVEGERLLAQVGGILGNVGRIVRSCHEDWDGTGYPDGLAAEDIPLVARIVRCCDAFSAMTSDRPYRKGRSAAEAIAELQRCSGTDFDSRVVDALAASVAAAG